MKLWHSSFGESRAGKKEREKEERKSMVTSVSVATCGLLFFCFSVFWSAACGTRWAGRGICNKHSIVTCIWSRHIKANPQEILMCHLTSSQTIMKVLLSSGKNKVIQPRDMKIPTDMLNKFWQQKVIWTARSVLLHLQDLVSLKCVLRVSVCVRERERARQWNRDCAQFHQLQVVCHAQCVTD